MKFGTLKIENFLSIKEAEVDLSDRGLTLIEGQNLDDPSAKSNGAGKSSIVDALCWVLYGSTARGVTGDAVINRQAKKNCRVRIYVSEEKRAGRCYVIERYRKTAAGSGLTVEEIDGETVNLTKGTIAETQKEVESIIGCPQEVFVATVYAGQEAMPDLPNMTDKQLKMLIEEVMGVERLNAAYENAKAAQRAAQLAQTEAKQAYEAAVQVEQNILADRERMTKLCEGWLETQQHEIEELMKRKTMAEDLAKKTELEDIARQEKRKKLSAEIETLDKQIMGVESYRKTADECKQSAYALMREFEYSQREYQRLCDEAKKKVAEVKNISAKIGTKCSECGKVYTEEDMAEARAIAVEQAKACAQKTQEKKAVVLERQKNFQTAKARADEASAAVPDVSEAMNRRKVLQRELNETFNARATDWASSVAVYESQIQQKKSESNPYVALVSDYKTRVTQAHDAVGAKQAEMESADKNAAIKNELINIFGPSGVRAHVLETITPTLNDRTARYLDILSDGKLKATWTTLSKTKKGELREKFNIAVENTVGGGTFASLSGGEKRKVRVACCLALQEVVASRATKPIELFIADEVDHALDEAGVERLIGLLNEKAQTCGTLLVISHNPLRNWIDNTITVRKENGYSTIDG